MASEAVLIREVRRPAAMRRFVLLPRTLYRGDPCWAPPIWADEVRAYTAGKNAVLSHSDFTLFLAERDGRAVGRSLVYVDHNFNAYYKARTGFFGAFECVEDFAVARALDAAAERWLAARGMNRIRGPINPVSEMWGFLKEGFDVPPVFMAPYNPSFYNGFMDRLGYAKAKDLLAYEGSNEKGYRIPARFERFEAHLLARHPGLSVRRLSMRHLEREAEAIWRISNVAIADNWGYVPLERSELVDMVRRLKPIADPDAVWFVEASGVPVAYALGFPDLNVILRAIGGRLLPFGFLRILLGAKKVRDYRLFGLAVMPEWQGRGLDVLLYLQLYRALQPRIRRLEANYILEDNRRIRNALEKLDLELVKTYRVYEKPVSLRPAG
jgi:ribosomal protein S18 acetylase RimI-like enzyme